LVAPHVSSIGALTLQTTQIEGRPDIVIDLSQPGQLDTLKDKPFNIKEGTTFRMSVRFKVQHEVLSGMKYLQVVKRMGISNKTQEMIVRVSAPTREAVLTTVD
jgi:Rho GDP-dissociation inhibitor